MQEGSSSSAAAGNSSGDSGGIWRGLRAFLFGEEAHETLRERLEEVIATHEDEAERPIAGDLAPVERQMVRNLLHFGERDAGDLGVPRADIVAVEEKIAFADLVQCFATEGHSRLLVYRESLDDVIGMVHIKDVFNILAAGAPPPASVSELIRQPLFVPQSMGAIDLLLQMQTSRTHLAVVLDEYTGTEGLITIEDLIEEIVGAIEDEHDDAPNVLMSPVDGGVWEADARAELEDVAERIDARLANVEEDVETLGGLAFVLAGHVPEVGERLEHDSGWTLEILEADTRRVSRLRLHPPMASEAH
ncbi:hemolysin family protein [Sphingomonas baiyangensis]|uniref:HlyC/CorC family transporter n=1 Tax=Sphingomonas baiyangensis TaxID=2572576 RepID=A0A4U1L2R0_9SPHN|nr:hemolysin family protein [Sphingomonas baiyangensis]TKD50473.1 HlyC/CorC family transporter [Sphingomonas baiyangensis]